MSAAGNLGRYHPSPFSRGRKAAATAAVKVVKMTPHRCTSTVAAKKKQMTDPSARQRKSLKLPRRKPATCLHPWIETKTLPLNLLERPRRCSARCPHRRTRTLTLATQDRRKRNRPCQALECGRVCRVPVNLMLGTATTGPWRGDDRQKAVLAAKARRSNSKQRQGCPRLPTRRQRGAEATRPNTTGKGRGRHGNGWSRTPSNVGKAVRRAKRPPYRLKSSAFAAGRNTLC